MTPFVTKPHGARAQRVKQTEVTSLAPNQSGGTVMRSYVCKFVGSLPPHVLQTGGMFEDIRIAPRKTDEEGTVP